MMDANGVFRQLKLSIGLLRAKHILGIEGGNTFVLLQAVLQNKTFVQHVLTDDFCIGRGLHFAIRLEKTPIDVVHQEFFNPSPFRFTGHDSRWNAVIGFKT